MAAIRQGDPLAALGRLPDELPARRDVLRAVLFDLMGARKRFSRSPALFSSLALAVFRYQTRANPIYGAFVRGRGIDPDSLEDPDDIPAVPTEAFKEFSLLCQDPRPPEAAFRTTGTTGGEYRRGVHQVRDLALYRASLLSSAGHHLGLGSAEPEAFAAAGQFTANRQRKRIRIRILSITPDPTLRRDSSLSYMIGAWMDAWDDGGGDFFADPDWRLRSEELTTALRKAERDGVTTLLVGTAFAFVQWLDEAGTSSLVALPEGSLIVETGGFKGRSQEVSKSSLYERLSRTVGVPLGRVVNEYGMTELMSQFYEPVLSGVVPPEPTERWHVAPWWVRTRVVDPDTLMTAPLGQAGLLCHLDLANLDSVSAVLSHDLGIAVHGGFKVLGRASGAEPRGCSLAMEELIAAAPGGSRP